MPPMVAQTSLPERVASQAEFTVNNVKQTDYQHPDNIDVNLGIYDCDCNGFVSFVLEGVAPRHYGLIPKEESQPRPRAFKYYEFLASLALESIDGWRGIDLLKDARRGDIIAWRFPKIEAGHDTGHVLLVAETPQVNDSGILIVRVYDSANEPHFDDTREAGTSGVGSGFINFEVNEAGGPMAFQFAPGDGFATFPIAIGRLEPFAE